MNILALETSSDACSIALMTNGKIFLKHQILPKQHAHIILGWVNDLLDEASIKLSELDAVAYSCGPGSFTGIRIGASVGQGIAFAIDKPLIAVPSLQVIAEGIYRQCRAEKVMVILDAKMGQVYCGYYVLSNDEIMMPHQADKICLLDEIDYSSIDEQWLLISDIQNVLASGFNTGSCGQTSGRPDLILNAQDTLLIAARILKEGEMKSLDEALPIYLREESAWKK